MEVATDGNYTNVAQKKAQTINERQTAKDKQKTRDSGMEMTHGTAEKYTVCSV